MAVPLITQLAKLHITVQRQQNIINKLLPLLGYEANKHFDTVVQESNEKNCLRKILQMHQATVRTLTLLHSVQSRQDKKFIKI